MKKLLLLSAIAVIFTACGNTDKPVDQVPVAEPTAAETAEPATATTALTADSILDNKLFSQALNSADSEFCDGIVDASVKTECQEVVEALQLTTTALANNDKSSCESISLDRYKASCLQSLSKQIEKEAAREKILSNITEENELMNQYIEKGELEKCDSLENEGFRESCKVNIKALNNS